MKLLVFGANDIATCLLRWAPDIGYDTVLVDPRAEQITDEHRARAGVVTASFGECGLDEDVVFDAAHVDHDAPGMASEVAAVLAAGARTVSLLASRRHAPDFLSVETIRELSQPARAGDAVRVGERDYLAVARLDGPVAGMGGAALRLPQVSHREAPDDLRRAVGRPVVHHQDLPPVLRVVAP